MVGLGAARVVGDWWPLTDFNLGVNLVPATRHIITVQPMRASAIFATLNLARRLLRLSIDSGHSTNLSIASLINSDLSTFPPLILRASLILSSFIS